MTRWNDAILWDADVNWDTSSPPTYYFTPPAVHDNPPFLPETRGRTLMLARHRRAGRRGRSILKNAGVYTLLDVPTSDQVDAADIYYAGGHIYEISEDEANDLLAAGFKLILGFPGLILLEYDNALMTIGALLTESGQRLMSEYEI